MEIAIVVLLWLFICLQLLVIAGFLSISKNRFKPTDFPKVAILVPARNEAQNISECLNALLQLNYPKELLEIWVGDDQSSDDTAFIVQAFSEKHLHIHLCQIEDNMGSARAKGNVLAHLVDRCKAEYIFVTDADIVVGKNWVMSLLPNLQLPQMGMVSGTTLVKGNGFLEAGQSLDWTLGNGYLIGLNQLGLKSTAVGNNMAFTRQAYLATGGYENLPFSVTEDFQLFSAIRSKGFKTENRLEKASLNISKPQYDFIKLLHQRKRWMMGAQALPWYWAVIFGIQAFFYLGIFILAWLNLILALKIWAIKWVLQQSYLLLIHQRLQEKMPWLNFFGYEAYSLFMHVAMIGFYFSPTKMDWKGRKYP